MASAAGIHLDGTGKPTEIQISQCWVFNHARGIYMTARCAATPILTLNLTQKSTADFTPNLIETVPMFWQPRRTAS